MRERQFDLDASRDHGAVRTGKLQQFRPQPFSVRDVSELGEALLAFAKLLEQCIHDQLRRSWDVKQRPFCVGRDADHRRVEERYQLFIAAQRR